MRQRLGSQCQILPKDHSNARRNNHSVTGICTATDSCSSQRNKFGPQVWSTTNYCISEDLRKRHFNWKVAILNGISMWSRLFSALKINWKRAWFAMYFVHMEETRPFWVRICIFGQEISSNNISAPAQKCKRSVKTRKCQCYRATLTSSESACGMMHLQALIAPKLINKMRAETETIPIAVTKSRLGWPFTTCLETCEWLVVPFNGIQSLYISYPNAPCRKYVPTFPLECGHLSPNVSK